MQSWGSQSRFDIRDTGQEPTKSGMIGLLCAALGRPRDQTVDDLAALRMGVRLDQPGTLAVDYQTAGGNRSTSSGYGVATAEGSTPRTVVSRRHYLTDAIFLVGLESDDLDLLRHLQQALSAPQRQLSLGRKSYLPSEPPCLPDGLREGEPLDTTLRTYPSLARRPASGQQVRMVLEAADGDEVRHDQPVGAAFLTRSFARRRVRTTFLPTE
jgi:CRISPR system Cascade subunit CasD